MRNAVSFMSTNSEMECDPGAPPRLTLAQTATSRWTPVLITTTLLSIRDEEEEDDGKCRLVGKWI